MSQDVGRAPLDRRIRGAPGHTGGEFRDHLEGTAALLRDWGCRPALQRAGRYHAVYGNPEGRQALASAASGELAAEIGDEAEELVRLWSVVDRRGVVEAARAYTRAVQRGDDRIVLKLAAGGTVAVSRRVYLDLAYLHAANRVEVARRTGRNCRRLDPLRPLLCPEAAAQIERYRRPRLLVAWWRRLRRGGGPR